MKSELEEYVSDLASTALDKSRPLWQFHYIENYIGGPVIVQRIHHCYADGIALIQVFLSLTDKGPEPQPVALDPDRWRKRQIERSSVFRRLMGNKQEKKDTGWYELGNVPPDTYTVVITEKDRPEVRVSRTIRDGETVEWDVDLKAELEGR